MQVLVRYYSEGGNTRKLAERIGEGIESAQGAKALLTSTQEGTKEDFSPKNSWRSPDPTGCPPHP